MSGVETQDTQLIDLVLDGLRADPSLQSLLGNPARIFDEEAKAPAYPYLVLDRYERVDTSVIGAHCAEHRLQFASYSRHGGRSAAKLITSTLRLALQRLDLNPNRQRVVLIQPTYSDVMRARNPRILRGLLRARIHTEEI